MATLNSNGSYEDTLLKIQQAVDGDKVQLPAGTFVWMQMLTWTNKSIYLYGMGVGVTIIQDGRTPNELNQSLIEIHSCGIKIVEIAHMSIIGIQSTLDANRNSKIISIGGNSEQNKNFRFHHLYLLVGKRGIIVSGKNDGGLIDNCTINCDLNDQCQGVTIFGDASYSLVPGNTAASFPPGTTLQSGRNEGSLERVYMEDIIGNFAYNNDAFVEGYVGARWTFRNSTIFESQVGAHGLDSSEAGIHSMEVYNITRYITAGKGVNKNYVELRSGTGYVYNCNEIISPVGSYLGPNFQLITGRATGDAITYNRAYRSTHAGSAGSATYTAAPVGTQGQAVSFPNFAPTNRYFYTIWNLTDGSIGKILSNSGLTVTVEGMTGGVDNLFDPGDIVAIASQVGGMQTGLSKYDGNAAVTNGSGTHTGANGAAQLADSTKNWSVNQHVTPIRTIVWNMTSGAYGRPSANTSQGLTTKMIGGSRQTWNTGDVYVITIGYPGLEQVGTVGPTTLGPLNSSQTLAPFYEHNNTLNGAGTARISIGQQSDAIMAASGIPRPWPTDIIVSGRDFYPNTQLPGYTPAVYPHPARGEDSPDTIPVITDDPDSTTVFVGATVVLTVVATGSPLPSYQWKKNGNNIVGATLSSLTLENVQVSDSGSYTCVAANTAGSDTSSAAVVVVNALPDAGARIVRGGIQISIFISTP